MRDGWPVYVGKAYSAHTRFGTEHDRRAEALVAGVGGFANGAFATDHRDAMRCARAEKCDLKFLHRLESGEERGIVP